MKNQRCQNILRVASLAGIGGGAAPSLLFILAMKINSTSDSSYFGFFIVAATVGAGAGLLIAACISGLLFWFVNRFFDSQQPTVYQLNLFASAVFSFVISFLLNLILLYGALDGIVAHG